jgi:hypothetical protein
MQRRFLILPAAAAVGLAAEQAGPAGDLALLAGLIWFAPVWVGWEFGPMVVRSLAMLVAGFVLAVLFHLVLAFPGGRPPAAGIRTLVWAVYLEAALAAPGLALFRAPARDPTCWANCRDNVFLLRSLPALTQTIEAADRWFTAAAAAVLLAVCAWRLLMRRGLARAGVLSVALPAMVLAGASIGHAVALHWVPFEDPGTRPSC